MPHRNKQRPQALNVNTTQQLFEYLDRFEAKLDRALSEIDRVKREQRSIANTELSMELKQMADFTELLAEVEATRGDVASTNVFVTGLLAKIDELAAGMNDTEDQAKIVALSTDLKAIRSALPKAIVADTGGSTGGVLGSTGGV